MPMNSTELGSVLQASLRSFLKEGSSPIQNERDAYNLLAGAWVALISTGHPFAKTIRGFLEVSAQGFNVLNPEVERTYSAMPDNLDGMAILEAMLVHTNIVKREIPEIGGFHVRFFETYCGAMIKENGGLFAEVLRKEAPEEDKIDGWFCRWLAPGYVAYGEWVGPTDTEIASVDLCIERSKFPPDT